MKSSTNPTDVAKRRYTIRFWIAMAVYIITIFPISNAVSHAGGTTKIVLALTPLIPIIAVLLSVIDMLRGIDELERQIHIEALAVAAGVTALLALTYGFLEIAGLPRPSAWFTWGAVMVAWGIVTPLVSRKYKG